MRNAETCFAVPSRPGFGVSAVLVFGGGLPPSRVPWWLEKGLLLTLVASSGEYHQQKKK
jgi:hypothetical protein